MSEEKALPCPFCQGLSVTDILHGNGVGKSYEVAACRDVNCAGGIGWTRIEVWNRRTPDLATQRVVKAALDLCPSEGAWKDEPRMDYDEVQIDKGALKEFLEAVEALAARGGG